MKIVQIMPEFGLAGAETMCENLVYQLIKLGQDVVVVSMYDFHSAITDRLEKEGVDVRYLGKKPGLDFSMIFRIKRVLKECRADAVHTHRYCAQYAVPAAIMAGVKHRVHTVHSVAEKENGKLARKLNKFFFKHCRLIPVALSESIRDSVVAEYRMAEDRIPAIYNGIDLSKCQPKTNYSVDGNFKILHVGRFSEVKNHLGLLKAFREFHNKCQDSELWLVGDGEKRPEIESFISENDLTSSVKLFGLQSNVYGFLHDADMFTLTSHYEGIPMTMIEAMGTGLPLVATRVGGIPDMLDDESALLVPTEAEAIAEAFEKYYLNEDLRKANGLAALKRAERFSAEEMARSYFEVYNK